LFLSKSLLENKGQTGESIHTHTHTHTHEDSYTYNKEVSYLAFFYLDNEVFQNLGGMNNKVYTYDKYIFINN
jgi:hypothetical protein